MILNYLNSNELWFICQEKDVSKKYYKKINKKLLILIKFINYSYWGIIILTKGGMNMAIVLITAVLVVIMLGLSFLSYISENNLIEE